MKFCLSQFVMVLALGVAMHSGIACQTAELFAFSGENGTVFINRNGDVIFPQNYESARAFAEGLAALKRMANGGLSTNLDNWLFPIILMMFCLFPRALPLQK